MRCAPGPEVPAGGIGSVRAATPWMDQRMGLGSSAMANRLGPMWLNRVQRLAVPTHSGRFSRFALQADRVNALEPALEREGDEALMARSHALRQRARQGDSLNGLLVEAF